MSTGMAPAAWAPSTMTSASRAWARSAMARMGMTAPVDHRTWLMTDRPGPRRRWLARRPRRPARGRRPRRRRAGSRSTPMAVAHDEQRTEPARVLVAGGDGSIAGPPVDAVDGRVHAVGGAVVDGHVVDVGGDEAAAAARSSSSRSSAILNSSTLPRPTVSSQSDCCRHRGGGLGGQRTARPGVEVDPGGEGGKRRPGRSPVARHRRARPGVPGGSRPYHSHDVRTRPPRVPGDHRLVGRAARPGQRSHR